MLSDQRFQQLMEQVGLPNSRSLLQALRQCAMESAMEERRSMQSAASSLWDGVTDILTQPQIDKMELLYREELALLLGDET